jgi:hypothetical protein
LYPASEGFAFRITAKKRDAAQHRQRNLFEFVPAAEIFNETFKAYFKRCKA